MDEIDTMLSILYLGKKKSYYQMIAGGTVGKEKTEPSWAWRTQGSIVTCQAIILAYLTSSNSLVFPVIPPIRRNILPWVTLFPSSLTDSLCLQPGNRENRKEREREKEGFKTRGKHDIFVIVVQSLSRVRPFETPWTVAQQASLSFTISWLL